MNSVCKIDYPSHRELFIVKETLFTNLMHKKLKSNLSSSNTSLYHEEHDKCVNNIRSSFQTVSAVISRNKMINYLSFVLRSHSLFYCSVPKIATRTLLRFITYLHIRDDLIPLFTNHSTLKNLNYKSNTSPFHMNYFNEMLPSLMKNESPLTTSDALSILKKFLFQLMNFSDNSTKIDLWLMYQEKNFPLIRPQTLSDVSLLFSSNFTRVIFVRHPLERLASAYVDKITSLTNEPLSLYDLIRRAICRKYSIFYLTKDQRNFYRSRKQIFKIVEEPCQKVIPNFEHFISYLMSDLILHDVHWYPYSKLCRACLFKYNFIGKYEKIKEDLERLLLYLGLESNQWNYVNYMKTGKTREHYKSMYMTINNQLLCELQYFYEDDFKLFDYRLEDYLTANRTIQCSPVHMKQTKIKFRRLKVA